MDQPFRSTEIENEINALRQAEQPFAIATVVRTLASTSVRPGAKAVLDAEGSILAGFLGGGCVRGAVRRAAASAISSGEAKLVSLRPGDLLEDVGVQPGDSRDGIEFARNGCPSRGIVDVFIEPVLPSPMLVIFGQGPVAKTLAQLAQPLDFRIHQMDAVAAEELPHLGKAIGQKFVVVATQGQGDAIGLNAGLDLDPNYLAFVGSRKKFAALSARLRSEGVSGDALSKVHAPAGLHIHASTPEEIAVSILAQVVLERRLHRQTASTEQINDGDVLVLDQSTRRDEPRLKPVAGQSAVG
ncbi:MAG: XdhC family protein [Pseudomonadota bacterium]